MSSPIETVSGATFPEATDARTADLLLVIGNGRMSMHPLGERDLVIGRDSGVDVVIDHATLSRRHARVGGSPVTVQDLGSTNGTRLRGVVCKGGEPVPLHAGDSFAIGPFTFLAMTRGQDEIRSGPGGELLRIVDPTLAGVAPLIHDVAASSANVLILGETGTGKEVLATTIHELSHRGPLVRINCAALSESLLESELFGHEKGAFTGAATTRAGLLEAADGGTAVLDEIGELPLSMQAKLLRAVEQREVLRLGAVKPRQIDVRFIAATNRDLHAEVEAGRFRRDLYFRLDGVTLEILPLRERKNMIGPLALQFAAPARLGADVLEALAAHSWPGNVRELKAVIERAVLLARGQDPTVRHLAIGRGEARTTEPPPVRTAAPEPASSSAAPPPETLSEEERLDRDRVIEALEACVGNQTRAAKRLGISRTTLVNKLRLYRIPRPRG